VQHISSPHMALYYETLQRKPIKQGMSKIYNLYTVLEGGKKSLLFTFFFTQPNKNATNKR